MTQDVKELVSKNNIRGKGLKLNTLSRLNILSYLYEQQQIALYR